jgi:tetratricopeptide (TPR) repeat protein
LFVVKIAISILLLFSQPQNSFAKGTFVSSTAIYNESSHELVQKGNQLYGEGKLRMAMELYSQALAQNPDNLTAYFNRGTAHVQLLEFSLAIADFTHILEESPDFVPALHARATVYRQNNQLDEALDDNNFALKLEPNIAYLLHNRALTLRKLERDGEAIIDLDRAIQDDLGFAPAFKVRADIYFQHNSYEQAMADYLNALRVNPQDYDTIYNIGLTLSIFGELAPAIEAYSNVILMKPGHMRALVSRAELYQATGQALKALPDINQAIEISPNSSEAFRLRGFIYLDMGKPREASLDFELAKQLSQQN